MSDETTFTQSDLDRLMSEDPLSLSAQDIDQIILYQRKARRDFESGVKPEKPSGPKIKIDLVAMGMVKAEAPVTVKRRI